MTKFSLEILLVLNENHIESPATALSVGDILALMSQKQQKSYSTTFRHLGKLEKNGYVKCGLADGSAITYYISDTGKLFCSANL